MLEYNGESVTVTHTPTINVSMERNSRGVTWGVSIVGARDVHEAMELLDRTREEMASRFGYAVPNEVTR